VSDINAGTLDINTEIISSDNEQFVLYNSQGFEPSEDSKLEIVIKGQSAMPNIKDKVQAIWYCTSCICTQEHDWLIIGTVSKHHKPRLDARDWD